MIVIFGYRAFGSKPVAFRDDHCLTCAKTVVSLQLRSFYWLHLFWIPLVPIGFWKVWRCPSCGQPPHARTRSSPKLMRLLVAITCAVAAIAAWGSPVESDGAVLQWLLRLGAPVGALGAVAWYVWTPRDPNLAAILRTIPPSRTTQCPICSGAVADTAATCTSCGARRAAL